MFTFEPLSIFWTALHIGNSTLNLFPNIQILSHDSKPSVNICLLLFREKVNFLPISNPSFVFLDFNDEQVSVRSPIPGNPKNVFFLALKLYLTLRSQINLL